MAFKPNKVPNDIDNTVSAKSLIISFIVELIRRPEKFEGDLDQVSFRFLRKQVVDCFNSLVRCRLDNLLCRCSIYTSMYNLCISLDNLYIRVCRRLTLK